MELAAVLINMVALIAEACRNVEKLPAALISSGVIQATAALALAIFKSPGGIFLGHGKVPWYLYYSILIAVMIFGFLEAAAGFYVSGDLTQRRAMGMTILWVSILPIVLVAGLGGFVILH
jgi:hypothetical protein